MTRNIPTPETEVAETEAVAGRCPHCDRPFREEVLRDLHVGEVHHEDATDAERVAYEAALEEERDALFLYQLKVTVVLGLTYSTMAMLLLFLLG
jgi:hypothetical protein